MTVVIVAVVTVTVVIFVTLLIVTVATLAVGTVVIVTYFSAALGQLFAILAMFFGGSSLGMDLYSLSYAAYKTAHRNEAMGTMNCNLCTLHWPLNH